MIFNPLKVEELNTIRTKKTITYYVNASTGSDTNNGLTASTPFKTIQHAIDILPKWLDHTAVIRLAAGTYDRVNIYGFGGNGHVSINGAQDFSTGLEVEVVNYVVNGVHVKNCSAQVHLTGIMGVPSISVDGYGKVAFLAEGMSYMSCKWSRASGTSANASGETGYLVYHGGTLYMQYSSAYNLEKGIACGMNGRAFSAGMYGSGVTQGYYADDGGILHEGNNWGVSIGYSCTTKYARTRSGMLVKWDGTLAT